MGENSWQYLLIDLEQEGRFVELLPEQLRSIQSHHPDITEFLQQMYAAAKKHRKEIRGMLMRSDAFALSLA